ncbi:hypothetical protein ACPPVS_04325 [Cellulomonas sp. McL0617]|uniref:Tc toxin subunit A-related protein n=1 Tax=Cellulomonas sp. McL0617 TaxID=3415675 RepID=UPI003CEF67E8
MKAYASEIKYSHLEDLRAIVAATSTGQYEVDDATSAFERQVQNDLAAARQAHLDDELGIAIRGYSQLQALILKTAHPTLPVAAPSYPQWEVSYASSQLPAFLAMAAESASRTLPPLSTVPAGIVWPVPPDPAELVTHPQVFGAGVSSTLDTVHGLLTGAAGSVVAGDFAGAAKAYTQAIKAAGDQDLALVAHLHQDLGLVLERAGRADAATTELTTAQELFTKAGSGEGQVSALAALSGLFERQGDDARAKEVLAQAGAVSQKLGIFELGVTGVTGVADAPTRALTGRTVVGPGRGLPFRRIDGAPGLELAGAIPEPISQAETPSLQALAYVGELRTVDTFTILGTDASSTVSLAGDKAGNLTALYETMAVTDDLGLLYVQGLPATTFVAYLPYIYFFVIPMSLGDCYLASGDYASAETAYRNALTYPYLNLNVEVTQVWTRLAQTYVAWGDSIYRAAGDSAAGWPAAAVKYHLVVGSDGTVPATSPLYADARFAALKVRAAAIAAAADPTSVDDNPAVALPLTRARLRLSQIAAGQNFLGFAPDYLPPFSFEALQTNARYLAEHAGTMEQAYIQFKSQAENEEFREDQMDQQVDLAAASVVLEQDGVAQAQAGVAVAQRSKDYATTQLTNAQEASTAFGDVRWELEELTELDAWAQASAVDHDDEVKLTITGYDSFGSDHEPRNTVLQRLAAQRASLTDDLEQGRLDREVAAAQSYQAVAQAQVVQAQAGVAVAQQRVAVAQLQQAQAEANREFLDLREFSSRHWYEMAQVMKGLAADYLDMATSVAWLMQRAYAAETARDLHKIRLDYRNAGAGDVLGSDVLLRDVDFFTVDFLTSTRSKKAPIKVSFSLAQLYPSALRALRTTGVANLQTTLEQLDRLYPGFYLHKVRAVEVQFVGVSAASGVHGTLRNIGVSHFRAADGSVQQLVYPPDVLPLSLYDARTDAIVLRADSQQLRLFENNGAATMWRLELPLGTNEVDLSALLDVYLVVYLDAFFDGGLEGTVKAGLPTTGTAGRATSLRLQAPDELFFLRTQGSGDLVVSAADLPRTQKDLVRTSFTLRVSGAPATVVRLTPASTGTELVLTTDADGLVQGAPVASLLGGGVADRFTVHITAADNPTLAVGPGGVPDLSGITDVSVYQDYSFTWR